MCNLRKRNQLPECSFVTNEGHITYRADIENKVAFLHVKFRFVRFRFRFKACNIKTFISTALSVLSLSKKSNLMCFWMSSYMTLHNQLRKKMLCCFNKRPLSQSNPSLTGNEILWLCFAPNLHNITKTEFFVERSIFINSLFKKCDFHMSLNGLILHQKSKRIENRRLQLK